MASTPRFQVVYFPIRYSGTYLNRDATVLPSSQLGNSLSLQDVRSRQKRIAVLDDRSKRHRLTAEGGSVVRFSLFVLGGGRLGLRGPPFIRPPAGYMDWRTSQLALRHLKEKRRGAPPQHVTSSLATTFRGRLAATLLLIGRRARMMTSRVF